MSDTTYVHEVTQRKQLRVSLTMDADEARALADIASAAIDAAILLPGGSGEDSVVEGNAINVYNWATRAAATLDRAAGTTPDDQE
jgi:hypothetical protein